MPSVAGGVESPALVGVRRGDIACVAGAALDWSSIVSLLVLYWSSTDGALFPHTASRVGRTVAHRSGPRRGAGATPPPSPNRSLAATVGEMSGSIPTAPAAAWLSGFR
jgi:hypothetical protein